MSIAAPGPFAQALDRSNPSEEGRRWLFLPYDQLSDQLGPLASEPAGELGIVVVESPWKAGRRPYHRQKLALVIANLRHFALEQAARGVAVRHVVAEGPYRDALAPVAAELGPLRCQEPAERELRADLRPLVDEGAVEIVPHEGWITTSEEFEASVGAEPPWRMDTFYRAVRRRTGLLMEEGGPVGGKYSHDADNREPWKGEPEPPEPPRFEPDAVTREACGLVERRFSSHPGRLDPERLPATHEDAERQWRWALEECMESFGPYEDAMTRASTGLFHTRISPLLNLCRLLPLRVVEDVARADAPLSSREGFIRQVAGWREYVRHVHRATDGFRSIPGRSAPPISKRPGDGGWGRWAGETWQGSEGPATLDGGVRVSALRARGELPVAFWGEPSGLGCLDRVVEEVWEEGYSHHITRLMVLSNLATLLGVAPRDLTDWFWVAYQDAYDWVVEPNVLGMGSYALGDRMTTKPYVSGAAYIDRMSDYCAECRFDPKDDCPITSMYWDFLDRHQKVLGDNRRMSLPLASLRKRSVERRGRDGRVARAVRRRLAAGERVLPEDIA